jgi:hypothetical protein
LYRLLRPEHVSGNPVPLSSDAFTGFGRIDAPVHNSEVRRATQRLVFQSIRNFVNSLFEDSMVATGQQLCQEMHLRGINLRYLAYCYSIICRQESTGSNKHIDIRERKEVLVSLVSAEMMTRAIKSVIRDAMRRVTPRDGESARQFQERIIEKPLQHLNLMLRLVPGSLAYWSVVVRLSVQIKYGQYVSAISNEGWREFEKQSSTPSFLFFIFKAMLR